jgi:uncharacterized protein with FMN-binding domain
MRRVILAIVTTAVALVLLLTFKTQTQSAGPAGSPASVVGSPTPGTTSPGGTGGTSPESTARTSPTGTSTHGSGVTRTVTGNVAQTVYGPVQVKITVKDGRITAATAVQYPSGTPRDYQINSYAIPQLNAAAVAAGNAKIDSVSGATYTSGGYITSLQSAVDKAGIA